MTRINQSALAAATNTGARNVSVLESARISLLMAHHCGFSAAQPTTGVNVWQQRVGTDTVMVMRPTPDGSQIYAESAAPIWAVLRRNRKGGVVAEHEGCTLLEAVEIVRQMHLARKAA